MLQSFDHVCDKTFRVNVDDFCIVFTLRNQVACGLHEVGFAQAHTSVQKQRVISAARVFTDLLCRGPGQLIRLALDMLLETESGV